MGYVPRFTNDVFISYSHIDNQTVAKDGGWVTQFAERLRIRLSQLLGAKVEVWRDVRLGPGDAFSNKIQNGIKDAAVFIPIVSPGYHNSDWCQKELDAFTRAAAKTGGAVVGDVSRIMKVVKTPLDGDAQRTIAPAELGCEFYESDPQSGRFEEFDPTAPRFGQRLEELVQKVSPLLQTMRKLSTVYVGQDGVCDDHRKKLRQELEARRFLVLPDGPLPQEIDGAVAVIRQAMEKSSMSVHLIERPGQGDPGSIISNVELQVAGDLGLPRVVSVAQSTQPVLAANGREEVNKVPSLPFELSAGDRKTEVLDDKTIESIKETVLGELRTSRPSNGNTRGAADLIRVYLVCDRADHPVFNNNNARDIKSYLFQLGFEVKVPVSGSVDEALVRKDNREKLKECDGVLLYWESASDAWIDARLREVKKALGWRKARRFSGRAVYVTTPMEPWKELFDSREADVIIKQWTEFSAAALEPFIDLLRRPPAPSRS